MMDLRCLGKGVDADAAAHAWAGARRPLSTLHTRVAAQHIANEGAGGAAQRFTRALHTATETVGSSNTRPGHVRDRTHHLASLHDGSRLLKRMVAARAG